MAQWNHIRACENLSIPYEIRKLDKQLGGFTALEHRFIIISNTMKNDKRVWIHEISHALLHYMKFEGAAGCDTVLNALCEIQADSVAYLVCRVLGIPNKDYVKYCSTFAASLPLSRRGHLLDKQVDLIKKTAFQILNAGGYYD